MERYLQDVLGSNKFDGVEISRSKTMSSIRGKGNKTTEVALKMALVRARIRGWRLHDPALIGKPDFYFPAERLAIFVDGCFWHGCSRCGHTPKTRSTFWIAKFERNQSRDKRANRTLRSQGIRVIRIWEHMLKSNAGITSSIELVSSAITECSFARTGNR
jgi:DNA mismatch endonuclease (patch repair protein)